MRRLLCCACVTVWLAHPALAEEPAGPQILAKMDKAMNAFSDAIFESKLLVKQPSGAAREYAFTTYQKGSEKRLVRFSAPGDVKGMGVLLENRETMYVFLPGFQRVRRMGTHVKSQSFMGSDFGFEDMSQTQYAPVYDAKRIGVEDTAWVLELKAKAGKDLEFPRLKVWVDKAMSQPTRIEYYDGAGKKLKTEVRADYRKDSPVHHQPFRVIMTDHRRNDHSSEIVFTSTKIDSGLPNDLFSVRSLQRGR